MVKLKNLFCIFLKINLRILKKSEKNIKKLTLNKYLLKTNPDFI